MNIKSELSLSVSDFEKLIKKNKIYVDKTETIKRIRDLNETYHFLSRPRRFGKSLLISTLKNLFEGKKELFKNTYIYNQWDWNETYPVIHLDLNNLKAMSPGNFERSLSKYIDFVAKESFDIELKEGFSNEKLMYLITDVYKTYEKEVVVLIDEYDKPIIDNINTEIVAEIQRILKDFYGILKSADTKLEFVFITGITKFSKVSIFSELNNLIDLSLDENYSTICGYSQNELENYFKDFISEISNKYDKSSDIVLSTIKNWYDGYSWDGENFLYAPYSILRFFNTETVDNYWFETGTPSFLISLMDKQKNVNVLFDNNLKLYGYFPDFDIKNLDLKTVLLQSGYLTIKSKINKFDELDEYSLDIPNKEVRESLYSYIIGTHVNKAGKDVYPIAKNMFRQLISYDEVEFQKSIETLFESINYSLHSKLNDMEAFYHILFLSWMRLIGFNIQGEIMQLKGRLDAILLKDDYAIIMELKYNKRKNIDKMLTEAIDQIKKNDYYKPYQNKKKIIFVAIAFKNKEIKCKIKKFK